MGDELRTIKFNGKWVEAIIEGNFHCPDCSTLMILIGRWWAYAFCPKCQKYFIQE